MFNEKVEDFMAKLAAQTAPMQKNNSDFKAKTRVLEKISLNFPGAHGRYAIWPMDSVVTDYPFVTLFGTREICIPRKNISADGTENVFNAWIRILPKNAYQMKDLTGRVVSSLTAEEEQLLGEAGTVFDQLFDEIDARNNIDLSKDLLRKRNYTIFNAYCLNKWDFDDNRSPKRSNFSALFVCTAKGFVQAVEDNINERALMGGGDTSFIGSIYGREAEKRDGFMMFSIARSKTSAGYNVSVSHESGRAQMLQGITIPAEDVELMKDPVQAFLGYQANRDEENPDGSKRLFNAPLMKQAIAFMTEQLAQIRMAKSSGTSIEKAIADTNAKALANSTPTDKQGKPTNDPMLASMSQPQGQNNAAQNVAANNNAPFQTPPAAQIDPVTSAPVNNGQQGGFGGFGGGQSSPFAAPGFAKPQGGQGGFPF